MKKKLRKAIISVSAAILCSVQAVSSIPYYGSAASTQKYTWRMVEKLNANKIYSYLSGADSKGVGDYEYGGCISGELDTGLIINYVDDTLICILLDSGSVDFSKNRYLSKSTWYAPYGTTTFSLNYECCEIVPEEATITPLYVLVGDVNLDNKITEADRTIIAECILHGSDKENTLTEKQKIAADVNNDGKIGLQDAIAVDKFISGTLDKFPSGK